ncbi:MAG TPA: hypothetical protein VGQ20_09875 [Acidimicrobiales bacterium]|nr:hypothetical protein [Acidimicrobiales bacterium]
MKKSVRLMVATAVVSIVLAVPATSAFADTTGYEGQPGNQSHHGGPGGNGLLGYEGQPGNQGG